VQSAADAAVMPAAARCQALAHFFCHKRCGCNNQLPWFNTRWLVQLLRCVPTIVRHVVRIAHLAKLQRAAREHPASERHPKGANARVHQQRAPAIAPERQLKGS